MKIYPEIKVKRKTGNESFHANGKPMKDNLLSFWQWSASDLINNTMRGILAEYIVASALDLSKNNRTEWDSYDLETHDGIKIEIKSSAYIQSWTQNKLSNIQFSIRPTQGWDSNNNTYSAVIKRQSDVYVFCILNHKNQETIDPLNLDQWLFYVLATDALNQSVAKQKTITLSSLIQLHPKEVIYNELYSAIKEVTQTY